MAVVWGSGQQGEATTIVQLDGQGEAAWQDSWRVWEGGRIVAALWGGEPPLLRD
jgi:hypothetical protein